MKRQNWVLVVEDSEDDLLLLRRALDRQGSHGRVVVARDGAEALDILQGGTPAPSADFTPLPDLVLLDINLPELSGIEVLERLRAHESTRLLRVVMLSGSGNARDICRSYAAGASSYVRKPTSFERFQEVVADIGRYWLELNQQPFAVTG